jgi:hypothetical protein
MTVRAHAHTHISTCLDAQEMSTLWIKFVNFLKFNPLPRGTYGLSENNVLFTLIMFVTKKCISH